jgi:hypothetical protein
MGLTRDEWDFYLSLGPIEHDPGEQTIEQWVTTEAASFCAACRLEFGRAPSITDAEVAVRADVAGRLDRAAR